MARPAPVLTPKPTPRIGSFDARDFALSVLGTHADVVHVEFPPLDHLTPATRRTWARTMRQIADKLDPEIVADAS